MKLTKSQTNLFNPDKPGFGWMYTAESEIDTMLLKKLHFACGNLFPMEGNVVMARPGGVGNMKYIFEHHHPHQTAVLMVHSSQSAHHVNYFTNFLIRTRDIIELPKTSRSEIIKPEIDTLSIVNTPLWIPGENIPGFTDKSERGFAGEDFH